MDISSSALVSDRPWKVENTKHGFTSFPKCSKNILSTRYETFYLLQKDMGHVRWPIRATTPAWKCDCAALKCDCVALKCDCVA